MKVTPGLQESRESLSRTVRSFRIFRAERKKIEKRVDSIVAIGTTLISTRRITVKDDFNNMASGGGAAKACSCADAFVLRPFSHTAHDHDEATAHRHEHVHDHKGGCCCGHEHAAAEPVDTAIVARTSATTAVYRITNIDCPMEEALIRKRLGSVEGITGLEFNLMQRVLTVHHNLSSTLSIEDALRSIDMIPEPLGTEDKKDRSAVAPARMAWKKLAAAGVFAALSEGFEFALEWRVIERAENGFSIVETLPLLFAVVAILLGGLGTYRKGWLAVSNFNLNINALMSVAVTGAVLRQDC